MQKVKKVVEAAEKDLDLDKDKKEIDKDKKENKVDEKVKSNDNELLDAQSALETLLDAIKGKLAKKATTVDKIKPVVDGVSKTSEAPTPAAMQEVSKTENPKGYITAFLKKEAMDGNWTIVEKELEKAPSVEKPKQGIPVHMSVEQAELKSEQTDVKHGGKAVQEVKKLYNKLGPASEEAPVSWDKNSNESKEVKLLKTALEKERNEKKAILERENLREIADGIYNVVATLKEKKLVKAGSEKKIVTVLTQKFTNAEALQNLKLVIANLETSEEPITETEDIVEGVLPQVEPTSEETVDAVEALSNSWNK